MNPPSTSSYNNAFDRISGIPHSSFASSQPNLSSSSKAPPASIKPEPFSSTSAIPFGRTNIGLKSEPSTWLPRVKMDQAHQIPGTFQNDSSDDSDSDLEIIPSSAFRDNGRYVASPARPSSAHSGQKGPNALHLAMYGSKPVPGWAATHSTPSPSVNAHAHQHTSHNPFRLTITHHTHLVQPSEDMTMSTRNLDLNLELQ